MPDPVLQRNAREQREEAERNARLREMAEGAALGIQMRPPAQVIEIQGNPMVEHLQRPEGDYGGGITLQWRVPGSETAYRIVFNGSAVDDLHALLHSDPPSEEHAPTEPELPEDLEQMTIGQLREIARERGIEQPRGISAPELAKLLREQAVIDEEPAA